MCSEQQKSTGGFAMPTNTTGNIHSNDAHCDDENNAALLITTDVFTVNSEFQSAFALSQIT
jgi:hypothetical protein